jgi:hypothetical protein
LKYVLKNLFMKHVIALIYTHTKVDIGLFLKTRIRVRAKRYPDPRDE